MIVKKFGQWKQAATITRSMVGSYKKALDIAVTREAHFIRKKIVEGLRSQAPGGKAFAPHAASTKAVDKVRTKRKRRGKGKVLLASGGLRNSIQVKKLGDAKAFVGILRTSGKGKANVAEIHETGRSFVVPLTKKSRGLIMAAFRKSGMIKPGEGKAFVAVTIPARPFIAPIGEQYGKPKDVRKRFEKSLAEAMAYIFGKP